MINLKATVAECRIIYELKTKLESRRTSENVSKVVKLRDQFISQNTITVIYLDLDICLVLHYKMTKLFFFLKEIWHSPQ